MMLHNDEGTSDKEYLVIVDDNKIRTHWGPTRTLGQQQTKTYADNAAANREAAKIVAAKEKKGYVATTGAHPASDSLVSASTAYIVRQAVLNDLAGSLETLKAGNTLVVAGHHAPIERSLVHPATDNFGRHQVLIYQVDDASAETLTQISGYSAVVGDDIEFATFIVRLFNDDRRNIRRRQRFMDAVEAAGQLCGKTAQWS